MGILASLINLLLGTHTIINVAIAMVFRVAAGGIVAIFGTKPAVLVISGPMGTAAARVVLGLVIMRISPLPLLGAAVPGMVFTAILTPIMYPAMKKVMRFGLAGSERSRRNG